MTGTLPLVANAAGQHKLFREAFTGTYVTKGRRLLLSDAYGAIPGIGRGVLELRLTFGPDRGRRNHCSSFAGTGTLGSATRKDRVALALRGAECSSSWHAAYYLDAATYIVRGGSGKYVHASGSGKLQGIISVGSNGTVIDRVNGTLTL
ncbi:MAG: hypothetical protein M3Z66_05530 [Chloroflexota bacterium]|nr:hypothetical protein [Chloroflexota bacterium]